MDVERVLSRGRRRRTEGNEAILCFETTEEDKQAWTDKRVQMRCEGDIIGGREGGRRVSKCPNGGRKRRKEGRKR
jgi:hypothetical protein